jgi:ketosteroid isomerase-like protein
MHGTWVAATGCNAATTAVVERIYRARENGDVEAVLAELTEDATFSVMGQIAGQPLSPMIRGRAALEGYFKGLFMRWVWDGMDSRNMIMGSDSVAIEYTGHIIHTVSNQRFETAFCDVMVMRDGKVSAIREYCDTFTIVRIAGLAL